MRAVLTNLGCLILLILFLPLFAIFIGPLLVLAAVRGRQPAGPIVFDTVRYGPAGRIGAFMLGLASWILVWSGLVWVVINGLLFSSAVVDRLTATPAATSSVDIATTPAETPVSLETRPKAETPTPPPPTVAPTGTDTPTPLLPTPSPTSTPSMLTVTVSPTFTPGATPTMTEAPAANMPTSTATPNFTPTPASKPPERDEPGTLTRTPLPTLTLADRQAAIAAVEEGNTLLREAISLANEENIQKLETVWRETALKNAQAFATRLYEKYAKPLNVQFEYINLPAVTEPSNVAQAVIVSRETWTYGGPSQAKQEAFEFIYTLSRREGRWVITKYSYRNLPTATPTAAPAGSE